MSGGRFSCLARNGGVAARGRKSRDDIAAGNRGAAGLRLDQAINETEMVRAPGQNPKENWQLSLAHNLKRRRMAKSPLCLQPTRTPTERTGRQTPALVASDASAEVRPDPSEPPQPLSSILSGSVSELIFAPIELIETKNAAQVSSGPGQELRRPSPSEHARCRVREDCKPCPGCDPDGDGTDHGATFPPEIGRHRVT